MCPERIATRVTKKNKANNQYKAVKATSKTLNHKSNATYNSTTFPLERSLHLKSI